jgi:hypothetical protein
MFDRMIAPECSDFKTAIGSRHSSLQRFQPTRAEASVVRRKGPIEPMSWRPAVVEFEDSLSLIVLDAKQDARKQVGLIEFRFERDPRRLRSS